jgi:hypothetical protein
MAALVITGALPLSLYISSKKNAFRITGSAPVLYMALPSMAPE